MSEIHDKGAYIMLLSFFRSVAVSLIGVTIPLWGAGEAFAQGSAAAQAADAACSFRPLESSPTWVTSVTYVANLQELIIVDPVANRLLRYSSSGKLIGELGDPRLDRSAPFLPVSLEGSSEHGFVLQLVSGPAVVFNGDLEAIAEVNLRAPARGERFRLSSLYSQFTVYRDHIIGYGSVREVTSEGVSGGSSPPFELGLVGAEIDLSGGVLSDIDMLMSFSENRYYLLGHRYLGHTASAVYFLKIVGGYDAELYEVSVDGDRLRRIPLPKTSEFENVPVLQTESRGIESLKALFQELEGLDIPVSIHGQGDYLMIMTRSRDSSAPWQMYAIHTGTHEVVGPRPIPSSSVFLIAVPTERDVLFIEKKEVIGFGVQETSGILRVPTSWFIQPGETPLTRGVQCSGRN